nr:peptide-N(4)-(N-acetyl-beta-glucosaminyl) asparagine amidase [Tanacetum cinerariifolium]
MSWIDPVKCPTCKGTTKGIGSADPTVQEKRDGGGRVELYKCVNEACEHIRRFVRYGNPRTLLKTREGRCGE